MNELEWLSSHPEDAEKHSGKWVAVTEKGIVAAGESLSEVEISLKNKGISFNDVMVMKVPRKDEEMSIL